MADPIAKGVDKVFRDIQARDRADVEAVRQKIGVMSYAGETWPINPAKSKEPVTDLEVMKAAEAAERLHHQGDLHGGLGQEGYDALQEAAKKRRPKNLPFPDPNKHVR